MVKSINLKKGSALFSKLFVLTLIFIIFLGVVIPYSIARADTVAAGIVTVYPQEIDSVLHNPDMGWVFIDNAIPGHNDEGRTGSYPDIDNVAVLSDWAEMEPTEGNYNWTMVDNAINYWVGQGKRIHFRMSSDTMVIIPYAGYQNGCPQWLYDAGVPYQTRAEQGYNIKFPDYTNSLYMPKLTNFVSAWANRYKGNVNLDLVDLRGYGMWGEWHSGHDFTGITQRESYLQQIIDAWYNAWGQQKILALSNSYEWRTDMVPNCANPSTYTDYKAWSKFDYAFTKPKLVPRRDGVSGAMLQWDSKLLMDYFRANYKLPVTLEFFGKYSDYNQQGGFAGYNCETALNEALYMFHPNYMTMWGWDGDSGARDFYDNGKYWLDFGAKWMGYRFVLTKASYPQIVKPGETFTLDQTWINRAVGRCFNKYPLKVYLTDTNGNTIWSGSDNNFDQTGFVRGENYNIASHFTLPSNISAGTYDLRIAMVDGSGNPKIKLAIASMDSSTRYKIGTITVGDDSENFEGGSFTNSKYTAGWNNSYGTITSIPSKVVSVIYSANGATSASTDWYEFLYTDKSKIKLQGGASYNITFKYKCITAPGSGGSHYFVARTDTGGYSHDKGSTNWTESAGSDVRTRSINITLDDYDDYYLIWGLHYGGEMSVDEITIKKTAGAFGEGFETGSFFGTNYTAGVNGGSITADPLKVITGSYSAVGSTSTGTQWYEFLYGDTNKIHLDAGGTYTVTFKYRPVTKPDDNNGGFYYFCARTNLGGVTHDKGVTQWIDQSGNQPGTKTVTFTLDNYSDYYLLWGLHYGGEMAIDDIKVTKRTSDAVYESFEGGSFSSSKYANGGGGSGTITNDSSKVLNGTYSVYGTAAIGTDWSEFLQSDTSKLQLLPNTTYSVTFRYQPKTTVGIGGYYYFLARTDVGGITQDKGFMQWVDKAGDVNPLYKTFTFTTGNYSDYRLIWGIRKGGAVSIDEITVVKQ